NPFTFAFHPNTGEMLINDVGEGTYEEINTGSAGANYGWNQSEGPTSAPGITGPRYYYQHNNNGGCAIAGAPFYAPPTFTFPSDYANDYFFADLCTGFIRRLDLSSNMATGFATGVTSPVDLKVSADGALYYLARGNSANSGVVYRVQYQPTA